MAVGGGQDSFPGWVFHISTTFNDKLQNIIVNASKYTCNALVILHRHVPVAYIYGTYMHTEHTESPG